MPKMNSNSNSNDQNSFQNEKWKKKIHEKISKSLFIWPQHSLHRFLLDFLTFINQIRELANSIFELDVNFYDK